MRDLLDADGENRAVRAFLLQYQGNPQTTTRLMRDHLHLSGFTNCWPAWADVGSTHLTKAGAQLWLRHLFDLEK